MSVTALPLRVARAGWGSYNQSLQKHPLLTKTITAAVGFSIGDAVAQLSTEPKRNYNLARTLRMGAFGLLFAGPLQGHVWFNLLDKVQALLLGVVVLILVWKVQPPVLYSRLPVHWQLAAGPVLRPVHCFVRSQYHRDTPPSAPLCMAARVDRSRLSSPSVTRSL